MGSTPPWAPTASVLEPGPRPEFDGASLKKGRCRQGLFKGCGGASCHSTVTFDLLNELKMQFVFRSGIRTPKIKLQQTEFGSPEPCGVTEPEVIDGCPAGNSEAGPRFRAVCDRQRPGGYTHSRRSTLPVRSSRPMPRQPSGPV